MGLLSSPGDPEGLAANVILILEQPEFAQSLHVARQKVESYAWANLRDLWLRTYQSLFE